jgi:hypothetical protein
MAALTSPLDIPGCIVWLDGNDKTTMFLLSTGLNQVQTDGDAVGYWKNKAAWNSDLLSLNTLGTTTPGLSSFTHFPGTYQTARPVFKVQSNNTSILNFDGSDALTSYFNFPVPAPANSRGLTTFVTLSTGSPVANSRTYTHTINGLQDSVAGVGNVIPAFGPTTSGVIGSQTSPTGLTTTQTLRWSQFETYVCHHDGTKFTSYLNSLRSTTPNYATHSLDMTNVSISRVGAGIGAAGATFVNPARINVAEVIEYDRALTDSERIKVELYLNRKWNVNQRRTYAKQSGNWSDPNTWIEELVPLTSDNVFSNTYNVDIDQNILVQDLRNVALAPYVPTGGGMFTISAPVNVATLSGSGFVSNGVVPLLSSSASTGTVNLTGHIVGGSLANDCYGFRHIGNASVNLSGNVTAGNTTLSSYGLLFYADIESPSNLTINGNVSAGNASSNYGVSYTGGGDVTVTGYVSAGGAVVGADMCYGLTCIGNGSVYVASGISAGFGNICYGAYLSGGQTNSSVTIGSRGITAGPGAFSFGLYNAGETRSISITGNVAASTGSGSYGLNNAGNGNISILGNVAASTNLGSYGLTNIGNGNVSLTGNVTASTGSGSYGLTNIGNGNLSIRGNITASTGSGSYGLTNTGNGNTTLIGAIVGSTNTHGAECSGTGVVFLSGRATGGAGSNSYGLRCRSTELSAISAFPLGTAVFTGGTGTNCYGLLFGGSAAPLYVEGTITGGSGSGSHGAYIANSTSVKLFGNLNGGTGSSIGVYDAQSSSISLSGGAAGGSVSGAYGLHLAYNPSVINTNLYINGGQNRDITGGNGTSTHGVYINRVSDLTVERILNIRGGIGGNFCYGMYWAFPLSSCNIQASSIRGGTGGTNNHGLTIDVDCTANITGSVFATTWGHGIYVGSTYSYVSANTFFSPNLIVRGNVSASSASAAAYSAIYNSHSDVYVAGNVTGGAFSGAYGINNVGGNVDVRGNVNGGPAAGGHGIYASSGTERSTTNLIVRGNVTGGTVFNSNGVVNETNNGTFQLFGNLIARPSSGAVALRSGHWSSGTYGMLAKNYICGNVINAPDGGSAMTAFHCQFYPPASFGSYITYSSGYNTVLDMVLPDGFGMPEPWAVRSGVSYANDTRVGTCVVPDPRSVKLRTPVDNTEGLAILDPIDLYSISTAVLTAENTLGKLLSNSLTTEVAGNLVASWSEDFGSYSPTMISGLQLWLDASDSSTLFDATVGGNLVTTDGSAVARWADKSGNNRHAIQTTSTARPLLKTGIQAGKNVLRFDGTNHYFNINSIAAFFGSSHTIFAVAQTNTGGKNATSEAYQTVIAGTGFHQTISFRGYPLANIVHAEVWNSTQSQNATSTRPYSVGSWIVATRRVTASTASTVQLFLNKTAGIQQALSSGTVLRTPVEARIGCAQTVGSFDWFLNGQISEILIYNSALTPGQYQSIQSYLQSKWNIV